MIVFAMCCQIQFHYLSPTSKRVQGPHSRRGGRNGRIQETVVLVGQPAIPSGNFRQLALAALQVSEL